MWLPPGLTKRSVVNWLQLYLQWRKFQEDKLAILGIYQLPRTKRIGMQLPYSSGAAARQDVRPCQLSLCSKDRGEIKDQASLFGKTCFCGTFYPLLALLLYLRLSQVSLVQHSIIHSLSQGSSSKVDKLSSLL